MLHDWDDESVWRKQLYSATFRETQIGVGRPTSSHITLWFHLVDQVKRLVSKQWSKVVIYFETKLKANLVTYFETEGMQLVGGAATSESLEVGIQEFAFAMEDYGCIHSFSN